MTHTPGPWEADDESIYAKNADGSWQQIAELPGWRTNKWEVMSDTDCANARLIATAPDMAQTIRDLLSLHIAHHNHPHHARAREILRAIDGA